MPLFGQGSLSALSRRLRQVLRIPTCYVHVYDLWEADAADVLKGDDGADLRVLTKGDLELIDSERPGYSRLANEYLNNWAHGSGRSQRRQDRRDGVVLHEHTRKTRED